MRSLNHDPGTLFRALLLNQLPPDVRRILAQTPDADLDTLAKTADGIMDVEFVAAATRSVQNTSPIEVTHEEQANSGYGDVNALQRNHRIRQKHRTTTPTPTFVLCKYHTRFASKARSCEHFVDGRPCAMSPQLYQTELKYLGHIISAEVSRADPEKIEAIKTINPKDKKELQRFLGMVTYVGKYIPNLFQITYPLRVLLQKEIEWHLNDTHDSAIKHIKDMITTSSTLRHFDPSKEVIVTADASQYGLGAALLQEGRPECY
ncbi:retrovirus-related pol polyprotein from [Plakobranchus ocellatus]|uniref:Retrovirus-related pol polyprotein from n=1 Tax=Plakobranchus ocellatus TaxID=259542 RepID=A0AAV4B428_9GAST|nr:retrovirus-related pol polyprotein from [Plakobranchus ocellatus]